MFSKDACEKSCTPTSRVFPAKRPPPGLPWRIALLNLSCDRCGRRRVARLRFPSRQRPRLAAHLQNCIERSRSFDAKSGDDLFKGETRGCFDSSQAISPSRVDPSLMFDALSEQAKPMRSPKSAAQFPREGLTNNRRSLASIYTAALSLTPRRRDRRRAASSSTGGIGRCRENSLRLTLFHVLAKRSRRGARVVPNTRSQNPVLTPKLLES